MTIGSRGYIVTPCRQTTPERKETMDMDTERIVMERRIKALRRSMERALFNMKAYQKTDGVDVAAHELESALAEDDDTKAKGRL